MGRSSLPASALCALVVLLARPAASQFYGFVVDSTADGSDASPGDGICADALGACTLRAAIEEANTTPEPDGFDSIIFVIPGPGPRTIEPLAPLPPITQPVAIDGYYPYYPKNDDYTPLIELSGRSAGPGDGLYFATDSSLVGGLVINGWQKDADGRYGNGIVVAGSGVGVWGNYIGTDVTGTFAVPNESSGVLVTGNANAIGGFNVPHGNLVSGNGAAGIIVEGTGNGIGGNIIGLNAAGTRAVGNGLGVSVRGPYTQVGELRLVPPNVISGNAGPGIEILATASDSEVLGNLIGTDPTESLSFGNGGDGITILGAAGTVVGQSGLASNVIVGNGGHGVRAVAADNVTIAANRIRMNGGSGLLIESSGTTIGTMFDPNEIAFNAADGVTILGGSSQGNELYGNPIYGNGDLGIDLGDDGPTPNDPLDADEGPNALQNTPVMTSVQTAPGVTLVSGRLEGRPGTYQVFFFASEGCDDPERASAEWPLTLREVTIADYGTAQFEVSIPELAIGTGLTATAQDALGNTSELAACVAVFAAPSTTSVTTTTTTTTTTTLLGDPCLFKRQRLEEAAALLAADQCPSRAHVVRRLLRRATRTLHPRDVDVACRAQRLKRAERLADRVERILGESCRTPW